MNYKIAVELLNQEASVNIDVALGKTPSVLVEMQHSAASVDVNLTTPGPKGDSYVAPSSPSLIYADGLLSSITYGSGQTKSFTYTNGVLARLDLTDGGVVTRKTFNYSSGVLTSVTQVTL